MYMYMYMHECSVHVHVHYWSAKSGIASLTKVTVIFLQSFEYVCLGVGVDVGVGVIVWV